MTNPEFSNEFDVLYNNITSNQAPGLDEYEKSVFLTKAQDEILKSYFTPGLNKSQEGFDGSEVRQIDFSMIIKSQVYEDEIAVTFNMGDRWYSLDHKDAAKWSEVPITLSSQAQRDFVCFQTVEAGNYTVYPSTEGQYSEHKEAGELAKIFADAVNSTKHKVEVSDSTIYVYNPTFEFRKKFSDPVFDLRDNTRSIPLGADILAIINESAEVIRSGKTVRLTVVPIQYQEYSRVMSKPLKRPIKFQAWRLLESSDNKRVAELIIGPGDVLDKYIIRYVRRPRPIIVGPLDGLTINGYEYNENQECELDPIIQKEILQRAVELAKAAYTGDLTSQVALGQTSQTNMGIVTQSR